jgi:hypothetical protein
MQAATASSHAFRTAELLRHYRPIGSAALLAAMLYSNTHKRK